MKIINISTDTVRKESVKINKKSRPQTKMVRVEIYTEALFLLRSPVLCSREAG